MSKHTPGPWKVYWAGDRRSPVQIARAESEDYGGSPPREIARVAKTSNRAGKSFCAGDCMANARLIAAAPALLEAAIEAADWLCEYPEGSDQWERGQKLRAAIRQATGTD